ncbi:carboxylesterase/lipase family protein [Streptomyces sp. NPDC088387]|uniref:carboxylesterase/lipase family protein n=1 Tax=Streptomyces sp. NPDC088387 TaxID=3365859 RepID=UPI00382FEDF4
MSSHPVVRTPDGALRGTVEGPVSVFRGIPYAQPPTRSRRFAAPVPAGRWDGTRDAVEFGPPVSQFLPWQGPVQVSQDEGGVGTLTLNVWTPDRGAGRLPVLVWLHGGAYLVGTGADPGCDGSRLAAENGAVVVTLNYRLGAEGFARLEGAPDNRGLLDQIAALTWVQRNIAVFGGDPDQVTVFGGSAGANALAALLVMPAARELFQRAVLMSPAGSYLTSELAEVISAQLAADLGCKPVVDDFARMTSADVARADFELQARHGAYVQTWGRMALMPTIYSPVVDGESLPADPFTAIGAGAAVGVDLLCGYNRDEYRFFQLMAGPPAPGEDATAPGEAELDRVLDLSGPPGAAAAYRAANPRLDAGDLYELVMSDWIFRMPAVRLAEAQASSGGSAYLYELAHPIESAGRKTPHGAEAPLVFGAVGSQLDRMFYPQGFSLYEQELSAHVRQAITDFARSGRPGWPRLDTAQWTTRVWGEPGAAPAVDRALPVMSSHDIWAEVSFGALDLPAAGTDARRG